MYSRKRNGEPREERVGGMRTRGQERPGQAEPRGGGQRSEPRADAGGEEQAIWEVFLEEAPWK